MAAAHSNIAYQKIRTAQCGTEAATHHMQRIQAPLSEQSNDCEWGADLILMIRTNSITNRYLVDSLSDQAATMRGTNQ